MIRLVNQKPKVRCRGLSLIELLISLAITAVLLTATMLAINASFKAYGDAVEQASAHTTTRMVTQRLLALIRTSTAHGPLMPDTSVNPPVTLSGNTITSSFIELLDPNGDVIRTEYRAGDQELWIVVNAGAENEVAQPLLDRVSSCQFLANRRLNDQGLWVLNRGSIDLTVQPVSDGTLAIENGAATPIRVVASTMPRKIN